MNITKLTVTFENGNEAEFVGQPIIEVAAIPEMISKFEESVSAMSGQPAAAGLEVIHPAEVGSQPDALFVPEAAPEALAPEAAPAEVVADPAPAETALGNNVSLVLSQEHIDANPILAEKGFTAGQQIEALNVPQGESPVQTFVAALQ